MDAKHFQRRKLLRKFELTFLDHNLGFHIHMELLKMLPIPKMKTPL